jgi:hypothetical protein
MAAPHRALQLLKGLKRASNPSVGCLPNFEALLQTIHIYQQLWSIPVTSYAARSTQTI